MTELESFNRIKALETQVETLRNALQPFAQASRYISATADAGAPLRESTKASQFIDAGNVRNARRVWDETRPRKLGYPVDHPGLSSVASNLGLSTEQ